MKTRSPRECTVILTLKDRPNWTPFFFNYSLHGSLNYLVLDGSERPQDQEVPIVENVDYRQYPADRGAEDFICKIIDGLRICQSEFVLLADNDDIVLPVGVKYSLELLKSDSNLVGGGGPILGFFLDGSSGRFSLPLLLSNHVFASAHSSVIRANKYRQRHANLWNLVFRRELLLDAFQRISGTGLEDFHQLEWAVTDILLQYGKLGQQRIPHYARLENQTERAIQNLPPVIPPVQSEEWLQQYTSFQSAHIDFSPVQNAEFDYRWQLVNGRVQYSIVARGMQRIRSWIASKGLLKIEQIIKLAKFGIYVPVSAFPEPKNSVTSGASVGQA